MRKLLVLALVLGMVGIAAAADTGNMAPIKSTPVVPDNPINPDRQGGDTFATATVIGSLPYSDTGTTAGYANNYDEICPYSGSTSPDVVYVYTPGGVEAANIDLCGSGYDTKLYVYDANTLALVACNDDYYSDAVCGVFVSALFGVVLNPGTPYYIVVDGYGGSFGSYVLTVDAEPFEPCVIDCPAGGFPEGEPPLADGYVDNYNGGCNSAGFPFQNLTGDGAGNLTLCGVSGWYVGPNGGSYRDTDWFIATFGPAGVIDMTMDAEGEMYFFELGPQDCGSVGVIQLPIAGPCLENYMTVVGAPGSVSWIWAGSTSFTGGEDIDYVIWFSGLDAGVATENTSWSSMKALFE
jgi:hypothetical protein